MAATIRPTARGSPLLKLPAELRNNIYELCFTTKYDENDKIDILTAKPPACKALLLVSRQIYNEASLLYKTAYRTLWTENSFVMAVPSYSQDEDSNAARNAIKNTQSACFDHIKTLDIIFGIVASSTTSVALYDNGSVWFHGRYWLLTKYPAHQKVGIRGYDTRDALNAARDQTSSDHLLPLKGQLLFWVGDSKAALETHEKSAKVDKGATEWAWWT